VQASSPFVDIHCHLLPDIDDGPKSWDESLAMARMAVADGIGTIIVTPHQLGSYSHNDGDTIRSRTSQLQRFLDERGVSVRLLPGGDVRIEPDMLARIRRGDVLSLADKRKHVLLELPHEMYFPLDDVLKELRAAAMVGILSHPERNQGLLQHPRLLESLVRMGWLMQVTAGSILGTFGPRCQQFAEQMLQRGHVHFVATDAHSPKSRRPLMHRAFQRVAELVDHETAADVCCRNSARVAAGRDVPVRPSRARHRILAGWFGRRKAG